MSLVHLAFMSLQECALVPLLLGYLTQTALASTTFKSNLLTVLTYLLISATTLGALSLR